MKKPHFALSYLPQYLLFSVMWLLARWPYRYAAPLASAIGWLGYLIAGKRKKIALKNLQLCFGALDNRKHRKLLFAHFKSMGYSVLELCIIWFGKPDKQFKLDAVIGQEHLDAVTGSNLGAILLGFHFTDLEAGGQLLGQVIPRDKLACMYRDQENPLINYVMYQARDRVITPIPRENPRALIRALRSGVNAWYAADQDYGSRHSVFVPFFGHPAATVTALSDIVRMTGAKVVPFYQKRLAGGRFELHFLPPLDITGQDKVKDASILNRCAESVIRQRPADYLWTHRRFKTQQQGNAQDVYGFDKRVKRLIPLRKLHRFLTQGEIIAGNRERPEHIRLKNDINIYVIYTSRWHIPLRLPAKVKSVLTQNANAYYWGYVREKHCYLIFCDESKTKSE